MVIEQILEILYGERKDYKGTKIMRDLLNSNEKFKKLIIDGIKEGKIIGFTEELWKKIENQNMRRVNSFTEVFEKGYNLGNCTNIAIQLSFSFPNDCLIGCGRVDYLKGTLNSENGEHTWLEWKRKIYDPTFMIIIDSEYSKKLKYNQTDIYNLNSNSMYSAEKDFTNDPNLKTKTK